MTEDNVELDDKQANVELGDNEEISSGCCEAESEHCCWPNPWRSRICLTLLILASSMLYLAVALPMVSIYKDKDHYKDSEWQKGERPVCNELYKPQYQAWCRACVKQSVERCLKTIDDFIEAREKWQSWSNGSPQDYDYIYHNNIFRFRKGERIGYQAAGNCNVLKEQHEPVRFDDCSNRLHYSCGIDAKFLAIENFVNKNLEFFGQVDTYRAYYHPRYGYPWFVQEPYDDVFTYMTPIVLYTIEQERLDSAIQKWNSVAPANENYTYIALVEKKNGKIETVLYHEQCKCGDKCSMRIHEDAENIAAAVNTGRATQSSEGDAAATILELFAMIQDAINSRDIHMLEVEYDENIGYPTTLLIGRGFDCFQTRVSDRRRLYEDDSKEGWLNYIDHDGWNCDHPWSNDIVGVDITDLSYWRAFFDYAFFMNITDLVLV